MDDIQREYQEAYKQANGEAIRVRRSLRLTRAASNDTVRTASSSESSELVEKEKGK